MSYLSETNTKHINEDIIKRKEFYQYKIDIDDDSDELKHDHEKIKDYSQIFYSKNDS